MTKIGKQDGIVAEYNRLRDLDPAGTLLVKKDGKWPDISTLASVPVEQWKAFDKAQRRSQILKDDHDGVTPDPSPTPPIPIDPVFYQSGVFVAGGAGSNMGDPDAPQPDKGSDYNGRQWNPEQACDAFVRSGYPLALVQLYREQGGDYMSCGRARGMKVGLWDAWPSRARAELALSFSPDMYCAQAETGQGQAAMDAIGRAYEINPALSLAIVTNLEPSRTMSGFDTFMIERGVVLMPEAYSCENTAWQGAPGSGNSPRDFVDSLVSEGHNRGYTNVVPVLGCYWGWSVGQYQMKPGEIYWPYLAETMVHSDLA